MDVIRKIQKEVAAAGQALRHGSGERAKDLQRSKQRSFGKVLEDGVSSPVKAGKALGRIAARAVATAAIGQDRRSPLRQISVTHAARLAYFSPIIARCSAKYGVPVPLICGVILQESGGNPTAVSHCGARGLMQLMPATARRMGVTNINDPRQNIEGGVRYLRFLLERFRGNVPLAVAAYNCGEGNVEKYGNRIPPFPETRAYVPNVLSYARTVHHILGGARVSHVSRADQPPAPTGESLAGRFVKLA